MDNERELEKRTAWRQDADAAYQWKRRDDVPSERALLGWAGRRRILLHGVVNVRDNGLREMWFKLFQILEAVAVGALRGWTLMDLKKVCVA